MKAQKPRKGKRERGTRDSNGNAKHRSMARVTLTDCGFPPFHRQNEGGMGDKKVSDAISSADSKWALFWNTEIGFERGEHCLRVNIGERGKSRTNTFDSVFQYVSKLSWKRMNN